MIDDILPDNVLSDADYALVKCYLTRLMYPHHIVTQRDKDTNQVVTRNGISGLFATAGELRTTIRYEFGPEFNQPDFCKAFELVERIIAEHRDMII